MATPTALLVLDVQRGFVSDAAASVPSRIGALLDASFGSFAVVLATRYANRAGQPLWERGWRGMTSDEDRELCPELVRARVEVLDKGHTSAFRAQGLAERLEAAGAGRPALFGIETQVCVLHTAYEALDRGFEVVIAEDLCGARERRLHEAGLAVLGAKRGLELTTAERLAHG